MFKIVNISVQAKCALCKAVNQTSAKDPRLRQQTMVKSTLKYTELQLQISFSLLYFQMYAISFDWNQFFGETIVTLF